MKDTWQIQCFGKPLIAILLLIMIVIGLEGKSSSFRITGKETSLDKDQTLLRRYKQAVDAGKANQHIKMQGYWFNAFKDTEGYVWFSGHLTPNNKKLYRYNGYEALDMTMEIPAEDRDSLGWVYQVEDKFIWVIAKRRVFLWTGINFKAFSFGDHDTIDSVDRTYDDKLFIGGKRGYAIVVKDKITYAKRPDYKTQESFRFLQGDGFTQLSRVARAIQTSGTLLECRYTVKMKFIASIPYVIRMRCAPHNFDESLDVAFYDAKGRSETRIVDKAYLDSLYDAGVRHQPSFFGSADIGIYLALQGTNRLFYNPPNSKKFKDISLPKGFRIIATAKLGGEVILALRDSKLYLIDIEKAEPQISEDMSVALSPSEMTGSVYIVQRGDKIAMVYDNHNPIESSNRSLPLHIQFEAKSGISFKHNIIEGIEHRFMRNDLFTREDLNSGGYRIFGNDLFLSVKNSKVPGTWSIIAFVLSEQNRNYHLIQYASDESYVNLISCNNDVNELLVSARGGIDIIPMKRRVNEFISYLEPSHANGASQQIVNSAVGKILLVSSDKRRELWNLDKLREGVKTYNDGRLYIRNSNPQDILFYYVQDDKNRSLYSHNLKTGEKQKLGVYETAARYNAFTNHVSIWGRDNIEVISVSTQGIERKKYNLKPLKVIYDKVLAPYKLKFEDMVSPIYFNFNFISLDYLYLSPVKNDIQLIKQNGAWELMFGRAKEKKSILDVAKVPTIIEETMTLSAPMMIYDLRTEKLLYAPKWDGIYQINGKTYVSYIESIGKNKRLRISLLDGYRPKPEKNDLMLDITDRYNNLQPTANGFYCRVGNDELHYKRNGVWEHLKLTELAELGYFRKVEEQHGVLWLCYSEGIARFDIKTQQLTKYSSEDGLPQSIRDFVIRKDGKSLLIIGDTAFYEFSLHSFKPKVLVGYIQAGGIKHPTKKAIRLAYTSNSIRIPIDVLNVFDAAKSKLSYRLKGYDQDWKLREYIPYLEYDKVPAGKYVFEVVAYSSDGEASTPLAIPIRIDPPIYRTWWAIAIYLALLILVMRLIFLLRVRQLKQKNRHLEMLVEQRTAEIKEKQLQLKQSIDYAALIQKSLLVPEAEIAAVFPKQFCLWYPRDTVGGDIYWMYQIPDSAEILFALIDCTGHGVPGALLSMSVNSLIDIAVREQGLRSPKQILDYLDKGICSTLHQSHDKTQQDGVEMVLLKIAKAKREIIYACAGSSFMLWDNATNELCKYKGIKHGIGGTHYIKKYPIEEQSIIYVSGSQLYLHTDGIVDQPNPDLVGLKRLGQQGWNDLLSAIVSQPMQEQGIFLQAYVDRAIAYEEQRDDITVIGLALE